MYDIAKFSHMGFCGSNMVRPFVKVFIFKLGSIAFNNDTSIETKAGNDIYP